MSDPDQLDRDLADTRRKLGSDINRLNDTASPRTVVTTRVDKLKNSASAMKDRLMGSGDGPSAADKAGDAAGALGEKADAVSAKVSDMAGNAPAAVRDQAQGNPLAAGLIAFGVGWLLSSIAPSSTAERRAAEKIEANAGAVTEPLTQSAHDIADNLKQPVQESADAVKGTAADAADRTAQQAKDATGDVQDRLSD